MVAIDVTVTSKVSESVRARQLEALFDVPREPRQTRAWRFEAPYDDREWSVGLLVGPSGCGKSTLLRDQFGEPRALTWEADSVIDAFAPTVSMKDAAAACQAVGFNTIPAWLRPYEILSNGERFRVELARLLVEATPAATLVFDEFTSVVDRQVAKIGAHAVAKFARRHGLRVVVATCHYDVLEWLQPDWVIEPAEQRFTWRSVQPRPRVDVTISPVDYAAWRVFAPYHYLTNKLHRAARCFAAFVDGELAAFAGTLYRPHPKAQDIWGVSRLVTLPDWQGLGLAFVLADALGGAYAAIGQRLHTYPAHPALVHSFDRSPVWHLSRPPGYNMSTARGPSAGVETWRSGARPCATFDYVGPPLALDDASRLMATNHPALVSATQRAARTDTSPRAPVSACG